MVIHACKLYQPILVMCPPAGLARLCTRAHVCVRVCACVRREGGGDLPVTSKSSVRWKSKEFMCPSLSCDNRDSASVFQQAVRGAG